MKNATAALRANDNDFFYASFRLHPNGLTPIGTPSLSQWQECGRFLRQAEGSVHFWLGDWLRYGEAHFREDYAQAIALTGYSYHTLRRDKYLAERIPFERRRSDVDVAIHHELAPLDTKTQDLLMQKVEQEGLTVRQVRREKHRLNYEQVRSIQQGTNPGLFLGDCVEVLQQLPDETIDCIITDPPYGLEYQGTHRLLPFPKLVNDTAEKAFTLLDHALAVAQQKLRPNSHVYVFSSWSLYPEMLKTVGRYFQVKNLLVWVKNNWTVGDLEGNFAQQHEFIIFAHKGRRLLFGRRDANVLHFPRVATTAMRHPTEKPVNLLKYLLSKSTQPGETVLDMFMGSGSTCLAAKETQRKYVGVEIDEQWYQVALARLGEERPSL